MIRMDYPDVIYRTEREKFKAVVDEIEELHANGPARCWSAPSPSRSPSSSPRCSRAPAASRTRCSNAKQHETGEAAASLARQPARQTSAAARSGRSPTNMAGREARDIVLRATGVREARRPAHPRHRAPRVAAHRQPAARPLRPPGRPGLVALLPVPGRRPDAHLRRRAHQRPHGAARHGGGRCRSSIGLVTKADRERAEARSRAHNFEIRKHLLEYDDVMNQQRKVIYAQRRERAEGRETCTSTSWR